MNQLKSINPFTLSEISTVDELTDIEIGEILGRSEGTFSEFKLTSFDYRSERMFKVAELLEEDAGVYAELITAEMGKPLREAEAEVKKCAWVCRYYAEHAEQFLADHIILSDASKSKVIYQALGPLLAVMPWNFPFWQVFRFAAPSIMAGNTALLKHASNVQICAIAIENVFRKAGFPHGVFQNLSIRAAQVASVIASPEVVAVTLTGSESAGAHVATIAGKYLKKCVLELGGNNAFVVLNDADIDHAVDVALTARLLNGGQSCIAAKRFIIERDVHNTFLSKLISRLEGLKLGDPMKSETDLGPLFSVMQSDEVDQQVKLSIEQGAKLIFGGKKDHAFFEPVILTDVVPGMTVFNEETFGPVFAITMAESVQHALELSNKSDFGLGMQVFTTSDQSADLFINGADEGAVFVNTLVKSDPRLPFGGIKKSGYGRELAKEGILEFMNIKTVYIK